MTRKFVYCVFRYDEGPLIAFETLGVASLAAEQLHAIDAEFLPGYEAEVHPAGNFWGIKEIEVLGGVPTPAALRRLRDGD